MKPAGIYLHIPFCKQACHYCDFHFSTQLKLKTPLLKALTRELHLQQAYLGTAPVASIYLGGGTPSLLEAEEVSTLLQRIRQLFLLTPGAEITLEANPDDITLHKLQGFSAAGINRLSIGIQTFQPHLLQAINRVHDRNSALASVDLAREAGFSNFSIDLMYALPGSNLMLWKRDLATAMALRPMHIAAYCLTIEPRTAFGRWQQQGKIKRVAEEDAAQQFEVLTDVLTAHGYDHYEISNFSQPGYYAQHNANYWKQGHYLGIGPGAHSYNGTTRQHNVANNQQYIRSLQQSIVPSTMEELTPKDHINEYIMTSLRTRWGCSLRHLHTKYGHDLQKAAPHHLEQLLEQKLATLQDQTLTLTRAGKLLADRIAADLFVI